MKSNLQCFDDDRLTKEFAAAATALGDALLDAEPATTAARRMQAVEELLMSRGQETRLRLTSFLKNENRLVRYYAAKHLLGLIGEAARNVIEENAKFYFDPIAADARFTLRMVDSGQYTPK